MLREKGPTEPPEDEFTFEQRARRMEERFDKFAQLLDNLVQKVVKTSIERIQREYSALIDKHILEKERAENLKFVAGTFKITWAYKTFILKMELYYKDAEGHWVKEQNSCGMAMESLDDAFQTQFGFVPCYVNSRLTAQGIPVSCEVDIYGCLSEFIGTVVSEDVVTLLDINNSVPADMYNEEIKDKFPYTLKDTFMGFHCGNTASCKLSFCEMRNQKIMARSLPVEVTNGTLEGDIAPGDITFFRLQSTADAKLRAYIAHGEVLPVATDFLAVIFAITGRVLAFPCRRRW